jgi:hypothetical protein
MSQFSICGTSLQCSLPYPEKYGYKENDIVMLTEGDAEKQPTRATIVGHHQSLVYLH